MLRIKYIPVVLVSITACCLILCVTLSMGLGHVQYLPTLSETGILAPEKYIFTGSLTFCSVLMILTSFIYLSTMRDKIETTSRTDTLICCKCIKVNWVNWISFFAFITAGISLFILAIVPLNDCSATASDQSKTSYVTVIHLLFSALFFLSIITHMISGTVVSYQIYKKAEQKSKFWMIYKIVVSSIAVICWPIIPIIVAIIVSIACAGTWKNQGECPSRPVLSTMSAIMQYSVIISILAYLISYWHDFNITKLQITNVEESVMNLDENQAEFEDDDMNLTKEEMGHEEGDTIGL